MAEKKYVYAFEEAYGLGKELLGGKGAGLAEMTHIGVPVPEGFTISTEACTLYYESGKKIPEFVKEQIFKAIKGRIIRSCGIPGCRANIRNHTAFALYF